MAILIANNQNALRTPQLPQIKQADLHKDPNCSVINSNFNTIWAKLVALAGGSGTINLMAPVVAPDMQIPSQTQPPDNNASVLTKGAALQLFSPANLRTALGSGVFQTGSASAQSVQPLLTGGGAGINGDAIIGGGFTINGVSYTTMTFQGGVLVRVS